MDFNFNFLLQGDNTSDLKGCRVSFSEIAST